MSGPMKERELTPGTVFPVLGTLLFFLPERYREKLCCVTPLTQKVISYSDSPAQRFPILPTITWAFRCYPCLLAQRNRHPALSDGQERQQRSSLLQRGHSHRGQGGGEWQTNGGGRLWNADCSALMSTDRPLTSGDSLVIPPPTYDMHTYTVWPQSTILLNQLGGACSKRQIIDVTSISKLHVLTVYSTQFGCLVFRNDIASGIWLSKRTSVSTLCGGKAVLLTLA